MIDEEGRAGKGRPELKIYSARRIYHYRAARSGRENQSGSGYIGDFPIEVGYNSTGAELML
jgi:hypothetical protein